MLVDPFLIRTAHEFPRSNCEGAVCYVPDFPSFYRKE